MTDEDSFLAAICAAPREDLPRLAFADWLDDRAGPGDAERAAFIRLQIERYRLPETSPLPRLEGTLSKQLNWSWGRDFFPVMVVGKPRDDVPVGKIYELWNPDDPDERPLVVQYRADYKPTHGSMGWTGAFKVLPGRHEAQALWERERDLTHACPEWAYENGRPKCLGWLWARTLDGLENATWSTGSWTPEMYERGFPARLQMVGGDSWVRHADRILRTLPIEYVELVTLPQAKTNSWVDRTASYPERRTEAWLGGRERFDLDALDKPAPLALLRRYWPNIKFAHAKK